MTDRLQYELCPETGIGCHVVNQDSGLCKIDLMPDEAASLREFVKAGDLQGAKALLVSIDSTAGVAISDVDLQALVKEIV